MVRKKYWVDLFILPFFFILLLNFQLVDYGLMQLFGQLKLIYQSVPVQEVLVDPAVSSSVKTKLQFIQDVERYGVDSLGLKPTNNYRSYYDQKGKPLLWVVTASQPFDLVPYTWSFPFLGEVSYKGYFLKDRAEHLSEELRLAGFDVYAYDVSAWSTLGWLPDPILSGMLARDEGRLAELILHELTHASVYLKSDVDYNENLASFVGEQGAIRYLKYRFGKNSSIYLSYVQRLADDKQLTRHLVRGADALRVLYASDVFKKSRDLKPLYKQHMFDSIVSCLDTVRFYDPSRVSRAIKGHSWNNANFLSYLRYDAQKDSLEQIMILKDSCDLRRFIARISH